MMPSPPPQRRCAIYTRKSTEEGLEQAFNSLDAQREACAAYILSQKHEGWTTLPRGYDDGGFSGGSMDRPGLRQLLADVAAGGIDVVVVYKVDRLTRALADFARIVAIFDAAGVSFVSVTQAFNTTSSMGRLTLNVLLSFAQFEREVTAERVRDKIAASKAKGMWMGGVVPIGYRAEARSLRPVPEEAALVQRIFARYLALGSVHRLKAELDAAGLRTPERRHRDGSCSGGAAFSRGKLYALLANPLFIGRIRHHQEVHPGQHPAIVDEALWQAVQDRLAANRQSRSRRGAAERPSPLAGRLFDPDGRKMRPSHARRKGRRYRYYLSTDLVVGSVATGASGWRIPAGEIEAAVGSAVAARLREPGFLSEVLQFSQSAPEAAPRLIGRHLGVGGPARRTGVGRRPGGAPAADCPGRALPVRAARDGELRAAEGGAGRGGRRPCPLRLPAVPGGRAAAAAATRTGTAHRAPGRGRTGAEAGPAARAEADRGAHLGRRLSRSRPGADPQRHRPARRRQCRRRLALAAARLPGSRSGRGHPRRYPAHRSHRRATEAGLASCRCSGTSNGRCSASTNSKAEISASDREPIAKSEGASWRSNGQADPESALGAQPALWPPSTSRRHSQITQVVWLAVRMTVSLPRSHRHSQVS